MEVIKPNPGLLSASSYSGPPGIVIADPRTTNTIVHPAASDNDEAAAASTFAATSKSNTCFNCGKAGHWAQDCRLLSSPAPATAPSSGTPREVTIKGIMYEAAKAFGTRWRSRGNSTRGRGSDRGRGVDRGRSTRGGTRGNWRGQASRPHVHYDIEVLDNTEEDQDPAHQYEEDDAETEAILAAMEEGINANYQ